MKKLLLAVALMGGVMGAYAQDDSDFAPKAGSFSTEIQFNPFNGEGVFQNGGVFSGAYFCTDKVALMFDLGLGGTNSKTPTYDSDGKEVSYEKNYQGTFQLSIGAKYYFYNYKRINLYAGAKVAYVHKFAGNKNVWDIENDYWDWDNIGTGNGFGVYALTGINFNIYKGLYLGAELNAGFSDVIYINTTNKHKNYSGETSSKNYAGGHSFDGGFKVTPTFILGWNF